MQDVKMIDVSAKPITQRKAAALAVVEMAQATAAAIRGATIAKGDVFTSAQLAGILGVKAAPQILPLCHPLQIESSATSLKFIDAAQLLQMTSLKARPGQAYLAVTTQAVVTAKTGVEMEALTGASAAALCVYDMCKSIDREARILSLQLQHKSGGKSGEFDRRTKK